MLASRRRTSALRRYLPVVGLNIRPVIAPVVVGCATQMRGSKIVMMSAKFRRRRKLGWRDSAEKAGEVCIGVGMKGS